MSVKKLELTLAILKPHVVSNIYALTGIKKNILQNDFKVIQSKRMLMPKSLVETFYKEHKKKFFYNRLITFMSSGPLETYILARENAIKEWRKLMGPTKVYKAIYSEPDSIRGCFGLTDTRNATHGSDSAESAAKEISIFFPKFSIELFKEMEKHYRNSSLIFNEKDFVHIPNYSNLQEDIIPNEKVVLQN